jgi:putative endonuclease
MAALRTARRPTARARTGTTAEALVAGRLVGQGWAILARNVHVGRSELDIVAVDPGPPPALGVVEVRANRASAFGRPEETVDRAKVRALVRGVAVLRETGALPDGRLLPQLRVRVDLISVELGPSLARDVSGTVRRHLRGIVA